MGGKMKKIGIVFCMSLLTAIVLSTPAIGTDELRIITDRTPSHVAPLISKFEKDTGTKVISVHVDKGLISRLASRPGEADLVITKTENILELARQRGLLQPFVSDKLEKGLRPEFRDADNYYFTVSYRGRAIFYSKDRIKPDELSTYEDLASDKWKGRVCIRSGYHNYNISLFSQMAADIGIDRTKKFLKGLKANLARPPIGNDRAQIRAISEDKCDLSIGNSYYMGIMLSSEDQREWGLATKVFFPNQNDGGAYVMRGGAALTTAGRNVKKATEFLEFLISDYAQDFITNAIYAYSVKENFPIAKVNRSLGEGQKEVKNGKFKAKFIPLQKIEEHRTEIINILNELNFDSK